MLVADGTRLGIGLACVRDALKAHAKAVIIADLRLTEEAKHLVNVEKQVVFETCDVTVWNDLQNIADTSIKQFDDVPDLFIASAGVFEPVSLLDEPTSGQYNAPLKIPFLY